MKFTNKSKHLNRPYSLKGKLLVATPNIDGTYYHRSVIYLCEHDASGAIGLIINQPSNTLFAEILSFMNVKITKPISNKILVRRGGPTNADIGFVIHSPVGKWRTSTSIDKNIGITTSRDVLVAISQSKGPKLALVCSGLVNWSNHQLENEIKMHYWLVTTPLKNILFSKYLEEIWPAALLCATDISKTLWKINYQQDQ